MARGLLQKNGETRQIERIADEVSPYTLDIELDDDEGSLRIYDPRAFHAGRRAFCRRMLEAAAERPAFEKAEIDLAGASCRLEFDRRTATARTMADSSAAVQDAAAGCRSAGWPWWRRHAAHWLTLTAYRSADGVSLWETIDARPGRIKLRHAALSGDRSRIAHLAETLGALDGIECCRVSAWSRTLTVDFRPESPIAGRLLDAVEQALQDGKSAEAMTQELAARARAAGARGTVELATGFQRIRYLALAGGSFAMTLVGLVIPGIPTVPFLLATSYFLVRSSPRLDERLRRTAFVGPILQEWEQHQGLNWPSRMRLMGLTVAIVIVTVALAPASPVILVVILLIATLSLYGIARLPAPSPQRTAGIRLGRSARLAALALTCLTLAHPARRNGCHLAKKACNDYRTAVGCLRGAIRQTGNGGPSCESASAGFFFSPTRPTPGYRSVCSGVPQIGCIADRLAFDPDRSRQRARPQGWPTRPCRSQRGRF